MQHSNEVSSHDGAAAFTVMFHGLRVQCDSVEHVVEAVRALAPLEREVAVPTAVEAGTPLTGTGATSPIAIAVSELYREEPQWRRPVEIVRALRKRRVPGAKYTTVYAALRYGSFVKRNGRWNTQAAATL